MTHTRIAYSGLLIALHGFLLTRFTVTLSASDAPFEFLFTGVVPLVLGLALAAFGVILTVGTYETAFVRTVARWCLVGTAAMLLLVVTTILGTEPTAIRDLEALRSRTYLSNFLIGGAVGGTVTGLYAAQTRRQRRSLRNQANRLTVLNRLLRDRIINTAAVIAGHTERLRTRHAERSVEIIDQEADEIIDAVENVKHLSRTADGTAPSTATVDLADCLADAVRSVRSAHPDAAYDLDVPSDRSIEIRATPHVREVFRHLLENAVIHAESEPAAVAVELEATDRTATVSISDTGPGLPEDQRELLETGAISDYDDPSTGFGLNIVRLLTESFDGSVRTTVTERGTTVDVRFPRTAATTRAPDPFGAGGATTAPAVDVDRVLVTVCAGLLAGGLMGATLALVGDVIPVIGALYGIADPTVGWITHEFHSVVFALAYVGLLSASAPGIGDDALARVAAGVAFGTTLWVVAAGFVMPVWLLLVGVDAPFPNLTIGSLLAHGVWGVTVAGSYHLGDRWLAARETCAHR